MSGPPAPPLRFLAVVLGGWVLARGVMLAPGWTEFEATRVSTAVRKQASKQIASLPVRLPTRAAVDRLQRPSTPLRMSGWIRSVPLLPSPVFPRQRTSAAQEHGHKVAAGGDLARTDSPLAPRADPLASTIVSAPDASVAGSPHALATLPRAKRLSASAWAFVREGKTRQLATGGLLGGSQLGARLAYRLNDDPARPLALSARAYMPLHDSAAAEVAGGIEWQPFVLPVRLLAERRQAVGRRGRSAFALIAHGGISDARIAGPIIVDAYAQAGVVGARSRDLFADGAVRASVPVTGKLKVGVGVWGGTQPGVSRVDAGPQISWRLPVRGAGVTVAADWRLRVAGDAAPPSGPSLTLSTEF